MEARSQLRHRPLKRNYTQDNTGLPTKRKGRPTGPALKNTSINRSIGRHKGRPIGNYRWLERVPYHQLHAARRRYAVEQSERSRPRILIDASEVHCVGQIVEVNS